MKCFKDCRHFENIVRCNRVEVLLTWFRGPYLIFSASRSTAQPSRGSRDNLASKTVRRSKGVRLYRPDVDKSSSYTASCSDIRYECILRHQFRRCNIYIRTSRIWICFNCSILVLPPLLLSPINGIICLIKRYGV